MLSEIVRDFSQADFIAPQVAGLLGEGSVMLWLLVMGVNAQRWTEQASVAKRR